MPASPREQILLVEDEALIALAEQRLLSKAGYGVEIARRGEEAVGRALAAPLDLVLMDVDLGPGIDGGEAAKRIREGGGPPVVFLSSHAESAVIEKTRHSGGYGYIVKGSGDTVLLTSVRMALDLASAHARLAASEERWSSLARTAPDLIFALDRERRVTSINRGLEGLAADELIGTDFSLIVDEEDREAFVRAAGRVFDEGATVRRTCRLLPRPLSPRRYELYLGPARDSGGAVASVTVVARDVTAQFGLASGAELPPEENEREIREAMAVFDFEPIRGLCAAFAELTGICISVISREGEALVSSPDSQICRDFHRAGEDSLAVCKVSDKRAESLISSLGEKGYVEYVCPHGLREIALPLAIEGVHWGTLFFGQFLYEDDAVDEEALGERARRFGWDEAAYAEAYRGARNFSRRRISESMALFESFGKTVSRLAYTAFKARLLSRYGPAAAADAAVSAALEAKDRLYAQLQHRIKNSLALVSSLLSLQAGAMEAQEAARGLEEAQARVRAIGILYERLYKTRSVESIDLGAYLEEVAQAALSSRPESRGISLEADCERVSLGTDRAVTVGLVVNELAANAATHAFPAGSAGIIRLGLELDGSDVLLQIKDDGRGLPEGFSLRSERGIGSMLVYSLMDQLGGTIEAGVGIGGKGAGFSMRFPVASRKAASSFC